MSEFFDKDIAELLLQHLISIGITVLHQNEGVGEIRHDISGQEAFSVRLANVQVQLRHINFIEVWRDNWIEEYTSPQGGHRVKSEKHKDKINYVITFEPRVTVSEGVQALIALTRNFLRKVTSFEWRAFPGLSSRLEKDNLLNNRLLELLNRKLLDSLYIRKLSDDRVGITTNFNSRRLPSLEVIECIEAIAAHLNDFVVEQSRKRIEKRID